MPDTETTTNYHAMSNQDRLAMLESIREEAMRLDDYWERHGDHPEAVARWAVADMRHLLAQIIGDER